MGGKTNFHRPCNSFLDGPQCRAFSTSWHAKQLLPRKARPHLQTPPRTSTPLMNPSPPLGRIKLWRNSTRRETIWNRVSRLISRLKRGLGLSLGLGLGLGLEMDCTKAHLYNTLPWILDSLLKWRPCRFRALVYRQLRLNLTPKKRSTLRSLRIELPLSNILPCFQQYCYKGLRMADRSRNLVKQRSPPKFFGDWPSSGGRDLPIRSVHPTLATKGLRAIPKKAPIFLRPTNKRGEKWRKSTIWGYIRE